MILVEILVNDRRAELLRQHRQPRFIAAPIRGLELCSTQYLRGNDAVSTCWSFPGHRAGRFHHALGQGMDAGEGIWFHRLGAPGLCRCLPAA